MVRLRQWGEIGDNLGMMTEQGDMAVGRKCCDALSGDFAMSWVAPDLRSSGGHWRGPVSYTLQYYVRVVFGTAGLFMCLTFQ
jgi:hypothetical protein